MVHRFALECGAGSNYLPFASVSKDVVAEGYLNASLYQPPSVAMASDVRSIVQRYIEKLKKGPSAKPVPALRRSNREYGRVQFQEGATHKSVQIGLDHQSKVHLLRKVPQRQPPPPRDSAEGSNE